MKFIALVLSLTVATAATAAQADTWANAARSGSDLIVFEFAKDICPNTLKVTAATNVEKGMNFIADEARRASFTPQQQMLLTYMCGIYALGYSNGTRNN